MKKWRVCIAVPIMLVVVCGPRLYTRGNMHRLQAEIQQLKREIKQLELNVDRLRAERDMLRIKLKQYLETQSMAETPVDGTLQGNSRPEDK